MYLKRGILRGRKPIEIPSTYFSKEFKQVTTLLKNIILPKSPYFQIHFNVIRLFVKFKGNHFNKVS